MAGLTWIHLSDWHQGGRDSDRDLVRDKLIDDIKARKQTISSDLNQIDFIVFSGDIAYSGKKEEYNAARLQLFDPLYKATELNPDQLFVVPGNHDFDESLIPPDFKNPFESEEDLRKCLDKGNDRNLLLNPFEAYKGFTAEVTKQNSPDYASVKISEVESGKKIALLGLNSAFMCRRNKDSNDRVRDYGYLNVGELQVRNALQEINQDVNLKIAVMHHPLSYLWEYDQFRVKELLINECDFILHGHQHLPSIEQFNGTSGNCFIIPAGASYSSRVASDGRFTNAYNIVHLDLETRRGKVFLRRWNDRRREWTEDTETYPGGSFDIYLSSNKNQLSTSDSSIDVSSTSTQLSPKVQENVLVRGEILISGAGTKPHIIDGAFYMLDYGEVQSTREALFQQIESYSKRDILPYKYLFMSSNGCENWLRLCNNRDYKYFENSLSFLEVNIDNILNAIDGFDRDFIQLSPDFISLGVGNGKKDAVFINNLINRISRHQTTIQRKIYYYPYDISCKMITRAIQNLCDTNSNIAEKIKIKIIHGDFKDLHYFKPVFDFRPEPNIFSLLGNTFGNFQDENSLLGEVKKAMNKNDFLIIEVRLLEDFPDFSYEGEVIPDGNLIARKTFNFEPLESMNLILDESKMRYSEEKFKSIIPDTRTVVGTYYDFDVVFSEFYNKNSISRKDKRKHFASIELVGINYYDRKELSKFFKSHSFVIEWSNFEEKKGIGLYALRYNPTS